MEIAAVETIVFLRFGLPPEAETVLLLSSVCVLVRIFFGCLGQVGTVQLHPALCE